MGRKLDRTVKIVPKSEGYAFALFRVYGTAPNPHLQSNPSHRQQHHQHKQRQQKQHEYSHDATDNNNNDTTITDSKTKATAPKQPPRNTSGATTTTHSKHKQHRRHHPTPRHHPNHRKNHRRTPTHLSYGQSSYLTRATPRGASGPGRGSIPATLPLYVMPLLL